MTQTDIELDAIGLAEGWIEPKGVETPEEKDAIILKAWQHLIDTGLCWQLQGWFGRTAMWLIEEGLCVAPERKDGSIQKEG